MDSKICWVFGADKQFGRQVAESETTLFPYKKLKNRKTDRTVGLKVLENTIVQSNRTVSFSVFQFLVSQILLIRSTRIRFLCFVRWPFLKFKVSFFLLKN